MATPEPFETKLAASWPPQDWRDLTVLVAVSGGADSVALLRAMVATKADGPGSLHVGHLHHGVRGAEALADQQFVAELCTLLSVTFHAGQADAVSEASQRGDGIEEAARAVRYHFLQSKAEQIGARYVVTAHTADDQIETIFHRILRGTGISGLCGMPRARQLGPAVSLIRPLLSFRRQETVAYLDALGQDYRIDSSNRDACHTRNRIRHELLPKLAQDYNAHIDQALLHIGELACDAKRLIDAQVEQLREQAVSTQNTTCVSLDTRVLKAADRFVVRELFIRVWRDQGWRRQSMGYVQWQQLADIAAMPAGSKYCTSLPGGITVTRIGHSLSVAAQLDQSHSSAGNCSVSRRES